MARARNIKPSFFKNEELVELPFEQRLLFIGLWTLADREGRLECRPKRIKMEIFPADDVNVALGLDALVKSGFIQSYEFNGVKVIQILNFVKHQTPHGLEKDSDLPDENGFYTIHERGKNKCSTGKTLLSKSIETEQKQLENVFKTVLEPDRNALNPDSLNPDLLNPETLTHPATISINQPVPEKSDKSPGGAVALSITFRKHGVKTQPAHPHLIALADQGVTSETVAAACAEAHESKPGEVIGLGYVIAIIERWAKAGKSLKVQGAVVPEKSAVWWVTDGSVIAKGAELGMRPNPGELMSQFKGRIQAAIDNGGVSPVPKSNSTVVSIRSDDAPRKFRPESVAPLASLVRQRVH